MASLEASEVLIFCLADQLNPDVNSRIQIPTIEILQEGQHGRTRSKYLSAIVMKLMAEEGIQLSAVHSQALRDWLKTLDLTQNR